MIIIGNILSSVLCRRRIICRSVYYLVLPDDVKREVSTIEVIFPQKIWFSDEQALLEVALVHPDQGVEHVEKVTNVVEDHPGGVEHVVQLPEDHPARDEDEVVEDGEVDDTQPVVVVSLAGVHGQLAPAPAAAGDFAALRVLLLALRHEAEPVEEGVVGGPVLAGRVAVALIRFVEKIPN